MTRINYRWTNLFVLPFDGEGEGKGDPPTPTKTFTQEEVDQIIGNDRKRQEDKVRELISKTEALQKSQAATQSEKAMLEAQLEELRNSLLSDKELAEKEAKKRETQHLNDLKNLEMDRDTWKTRYHAETINRAILDSAVSADAYNPRQIVALLGPTARLAPVLDEAGQETGNFTVKVKFNTAKGKTLDIGVDDAIKAMLDEPENYGNMFKSQLKSGVGGQGNAPKPKVGDLKGMSASEYRERVRPTLKTGQ